VVFNLSIGDTRATGCITQQLIIFFFTFRHLLFISFFLFFHRFPSFCFFSSLFSSFFLTEFSHPKNSSQVLLGVAPIRLTIHCCTEYSSSTRSSKIWISLLSGAKEYFIPPLLMAIAHILQRYILNFRKKKSTHWKCGIMLGKKRCVTGECLKQNFLTEL
jgi:hypothetical protein